MTTVRELAVIAVGLTGLLGSAVRVAGEVVDVSGRATSEVVQLQGTNEVQTDRSEMFLPGTTTQPVVADARLEHQGLGGGTDAAALCVSVLSDPRVSQAVPPNDVGIDVGAFSLDPDVHFRAFGEVLSNRQVRFTSQELSLVNATLVRARSLVYVAGALVIVADDEMKDLTGVELEIRMHLEQARGTSAPASLVDGSLLVRGGPDGAIDLIGDGVIDPSRLLVINVLSTVPDLEQLGIHLATAIVFPAVSFGYEYNTTVGETFGLAFKFSVRVQNLTDRVGAAGVFGLPQVALDNVMTKVRHDDAGAKLQAGVSQLVDTAGSTPHPGGTTITVLPALCGMLGFESWALMAPAALGGFVWRRRVRGARRVRCAP